MGVKNKTQPVKQSRIMDLFLNTQAIHHAQSIEMYDKLSSPLL